MKPDGSTRRTRPCSGVTAAPLLDEDLGAGRDANGIRRQQVRDDLHPARLADLEERLAHGNDAFALAQSLEDRAVDRSDDVH